MRKFENFLLTIYAIIIDYNSCFFDSEGLQVFFLICAKFALVRF